MGRAATTNRARVAAPARPRTCSRLDGQLPFCGPGRSCCLVRLHGSPGAPPGRGAGSREIPCPPPTPAPRWRQSGGFVRAAARGKATATQGSNVRFGRKREQTGHLMAATGTLSAALFPAAGSHQAHDADWTLSVPSKRALPYPRLPHRHWRAPPLGSCSTAG